MAQVPLRMPQPGMAPPQQRPPHGTLMMGMQPPQASVPGVMVSMPAPVMATALPPQPAPPPTTVSIAPEVAHAVDGVVHHHQQQQHRHQHQHQHQHHQQHHHQQQYHQQSPVSQHQNNNQAQQQQTNLANTKEKTPMCLINELARFNKIQHQYRLTNEMGPAHKKRFTVTLKLGDEEYSAEGPSIKKAQHAAAAEALQKTDYKHPPPKTQRNIRLGRNITLAPLNGTWSDSVTLRGLPCGNITPTVELNALAMKRGEPAVYTFMDPPHPNPYITPNFNFRGMYNQVRGYPTYQTYDHPRRRQGPLYPQFDAQRYHYGKQPGYAPMFFVSLRVGVREYFGEGPTAQAARHDAAAKALSELKVLPVPEDNIHVQENGNAELDPNAELKSPISLVHEIALKRNLHVNFEVISEKGPPHMRTFVTRCSVGEIMTEGEGNGKKVSKKRAAEKMLDELKKLPPPSPTAMIARIKRKPNATKKKTRNLIKVYEEQKAKPEYGEDINPISRLIQIQQAKKEKEPVYTLIEERGVPRRREFVMEVTVGQHSCTGTGPNKKLAKRAAAEGLLQLLGYSRPTTQPGKPSIKTPGDGNQESDKNRKVTFLDEAGDKGNEVLTSISGAGGSGGRQLVPGLLLMTDTSAVQSYGQQTSNKSSGLGLSSLGMSPNNLVNMQTTATIAKELLKGGTSPTAEALVKSGQIQKMSSPSVPSQVPGQAVRPKDQLLYLAQLLNFQVQFSDFPKGNQSEFLSLVSLSTEPPQVCHGAGSTIDASHDQAALTALHQLSELGLDSVTSSGGLKKDMKSLAGGDGLHLTSGQKQSMTAPTITANGAVGK